MTEIQPAASSGSILIWGPTKVGKTLDVHHALPNAITLLSEPDGLSSVETSLGYTPPHIPLVSIDAPYVEAMQHIGRTIIPAVQAGQFGAVIIDTLSELALRLQAAHSEKVTSDPRKLYPAIALQVGTIIRTLQTLPVWLVAICHRQNPVLGEKSRRGGPRLPGSLVEDIPFMFSVILEAAIDHGLGEPRRIYRCDQNDSMYIMGDRWGVAPKKQDMDLRRVILARMYPNTPLPALAPKPIRKPASTEPEVTKPGPVVPVGEEAKNG